MIISKNIDGAQEITLIAALKRGVVPCTGQTLSYASRLRLLLGALFSQRKRQIELNRKEDGLLESLQILDFVRWAIIDDDSKLMLAVSFDGPWEPYIRKIVEKAGPVLDVIFCHCDDYAGNSCYDGYPKFSAWVRKYQIEIPFIHTANADLSVDDVRYLKEFEQAHSRGDSAVALANMKYLKAPEPLERVFALFTLRAFFVGPGGTLSDREYFDRVSFAILRPDFPALEQALLALQKANPHPGLRDAATAAWLKERFAQEKSFALHPERAAMTNRIDDPSEIQGNILSSYSDAPTEATHGAVVLVRFKGKAQGAAFLTRILPSISFEGDGRAIKLSLALTCEGLRTLGLSAAELALFPREFQEGLEQRAALLGDIGSNHPERWSLPEANWSPGNASGDPIRLMLVDAVLNLQMSSKDEGHELLNELRTFLERRVQGEEIELLHVQPTRRRLPGGHLGAKDGVSQPYANGAAEIAASAAARSGRSLAKQDQVPTGELLLGYENRSGEPSSVPDGLRLNSTFTAIRKMSQDPGVYASLAESNQLELALGRGADGTNLIDHTDSNAFDYAQDQNGAKCPFFSHVRRANPRTEREARAADEDNPPSPRILRRGMSYGPEYQPGSNDGAKRGVMFMVIAASLAEQYEIVQRWVNGGNSTGVLSAHPDLIAGTYPVDSKRQLQCPAGAGGQVTTLPVPSKPAAVLEWGLYAFVPSRSALKVLANTQRAPFLVPSKDATPEPTLDPQQFGAERLSKDGDIMKARLEDVFRPDTIRDTLTTVLGKAGIGKAAEFGVIIGAPQLVKEALTSPAKYSVRNYWARMSQCQATLYLGMDPDPKPLGSLHDPFVAEVPPGRYKDESEQANAFIWGIGFGKAFAAARKAATQWFAEQDARYQGLQALIAAADHDLAEALAQPQALNLVALSARVIRDVACDLYGLPDTLLSDDLDLDWPADAEPQAAKTAVRCPVDLTSVFAHVFPPRPSYAASVEASTRGPQIKAKVQQWYRTLSDQEHDDSPLLWRFRGQDADFVERTIIGLLSGFAVPTNGTLLGVLKQLVATDELWRLQRALPIDTAADDELRARMQPITERVYDLMINAPVPALITRTPMVEDPPLKPPEVVGLHLGYAATAAKTEGRSDAWKFLFGDVPETLLAQGETATHRCPGQQMALGVIVGTVYSLLEQKRLKKVGQSALTLSKY